jgi:DNA-binding GntR family transcriptional regulator
VTPETADPLAKISPIPPGGGARATSVHAHLRNLILNGSLQPGTVLNQVGLAPRLGVSRTPLREAMRMLQEEGLIEAKPQMRARVAVFDPAELECVYVQRILLEGLAITITTPQLAGDGVAELDRLIAVMHEELERHDIPAWREANRKLHLLLISGVGDELRRTITQNMDRTDRYRRLFDRDPMLIYGEPEHRAIVEAIRRGEAAVAAAEAARHLARTTLTLIAHLAPDYEPTAIRAALALFGPGRQSPSAKQLRARGS